MKKLLLSLLALTTFASFAQTGKLRVRLTEPASGSTITSGQPVTFKFYIVNLDTVALDSGKVAVNIGSFSGTTYTPLMQPSLLSGVNIAVGDSQEFTRTYTLTVNGGGGNASICLGGYYVVGTTATFNGVGCGVYNLFNSVNEFAALAKTVSVYPNPVKDILNVSIDYNKEKVISIYDITGKKLESVKSEQNNTEINVSNYNKGFYLYEIRTAAGDLIKSGKFTVNR